MAWYDEGGDAGGGFGTPPPQNTGYPVGWVPLGAQQIGMNGGSPFTLNSSNYNQALDYVKNNKSWEDLNSQQYSSDAGGGFGADTLGAGTYRNYYVPGIGQVSYDIGKGSLLQFNGAQTPSGNGSNDGWQYQEWLPGGQMTSNLSHTNTGGWLDKNMPAMTMAGIAAIGGAAIGGAMGAGSGAAGSGGGWVSAEGGAGYLGGAAADASAFGGIAPGWVSAEGGSGYLNGAAMDGTMPVSYGGWNSAEGGAGYGLDGAPVDRIAGASVGSTDWLSHAQKLAKALSSGNSVAPSGQGGSSGTSPNGNFFSQAQPQAIDLMPKFSAAPLEQNPDYTAASNSQNINRLAQALRDYKGKVYG